MTSLRCSETVRCGATGCPEACDYYAAKREQSRYNEIPYEKQPAPRYGARNRHERRAGKTGVLT